jgi:hypothetical protein
MGAVRKMRSSVTTINGRLRYSRTPTTAELDLIPLVNVVEFELNDKELRDLRSELYKINRDGIRRFRTLKEGTLVLIWRIK